MRYPLMRDFLTGLTALAGLVGLIATLLIAGELTGIAERRYEVTVHVSNANGLSPSSAVTLNGVKIGSVSSAAVRDSAAGSGATLVLRVREDVRIPRAATVAIERSFVGDASLEFTVPEGLSAEQLSDAIPPGGVIDAGAAPGMLARLEGMVKGPLDRLTETAGRVDGLVEEWTNVGRRINEMVEPRTLADVEAGKQPNVRSAIERLDGAVADAQVWMKHTDVIGQAKDLITRAGNVFDEVMTTAKTWTGTGKTLDEETKLTAEQIRTLSGEAVTTLRAAENAADNFAQLVERINKGEGTAGQLATNPDLYRSLKDAADRLDRALTEVQLLVEKYKAEGIPLKL